jgi:hypothetical protein
MRHVWYMVRVRPSFSHIPQIQVLMLTCLLLTNAMLSFAPPPLAPTASNNGDVRRDIARCSVSRSALPLDIFSSSAQLFESSSRRSKARTCLLLFVCRCLECPHRDLCIWTLNEPSFQTVVELEARGSRRGRYLRPPTEHRTKAVCRLRAARRLEPLSLLWSCRVR